VEEKEFKTLENLTTAR